MFHFVRGLRRAFVASSVCGALVSFTPPPALAQSSSGSSGLLLSGDEARVPPDAPEMTMMAEAIATGDQRIDALLSGYKWSLGTITYSFYKSSVFNGQYYGSETGVTEVSEGVKQNVRAIMAWYGTLLNVNFVEVSETTSTVGHIRVMSSNMSAYAYAYYPSSSTMFHVGGDVHLNPAYDRLGDTNGFQNTAGYHGFVSIIHEVGHALGLKHPHTGTPNLPAGEDSFTNTVMSYNFYGNSPGTPMAFDVQALQYLYGARPHRTSNDTYVFSRDDADQYSLSGQLFVTPSAGTKQAIWDGGGYNVLDFSGVSGSATGYRIDTKPLGWITTGGNYLTTYYQRGTSVGPGVRIHKVINSVSNDTIYANNDANTFSGYSPGRYTGNDVIHDATSADTVDLAGYSPSQVSQSTSGNDLVLSLAGYGTITVKNYYAGSQPVIAYSASTPRLSISDVVVQEGNSGTVNAAFLVTLSPSAGSPVSVNYVTSNGTAIAGSDYVGGSGTLVFSAGETQKTLNVIVYGDTSVEGNETFSVLLSAPSAGTEIVDNRGDATIMNDDVTSNTPPTAAVTANPTSGTAPLSVSFSSAGSSDPGGMIVSYVWTFGNGAASASPHPMYTYTVPGNYTATLTVTDNLGATNSKTIGITVGETASNQSPVVVLKANPTSGFAPHPVAFSSAGSYDPDGSIVSYAWTFGTGAASSAASPSYTYASPGTYTATLTVTDNKGKTASASVSISVKQTQKNQLPVAVLTASQTNGAAPLPVNFSSAGSYDPDGKIMSYKWAFGNGATSSLASATYTYAAAGTYTVVLTVTDQKGGTSSKSVDITVTAAPTSSPVMFVSSIHLEVVPSSTAWVGRAHVIVTDGDGKPVANAAVQGRWFGLAPSNYVAAYTDASGRAVFTSRYMWQKGGLGFSVSHISKAGLTYDPTRNGETSDTIYFDSPAAGGTQ